MTDDKSIDMTGRDLGEKTRRGGRMELGDFSRGKENAAITNLQFTVSQAARFALGGNVDRDTIISVLRDLADAIEDPNSIVEDLSPIPWDNF